MDELKRCPFCGGNASLYGNEESNQFNVMCHDCEASTGVDNLSRVVAAWNRRAEEPNEPLNLAELWQMGGEPVWVETMGEWRIVWVDRVGGCIRLYSIRNTISVDHVLRNNGRIYRRKPGGDGR